MSRFHIEADVAFLTTAEGGRRTALPSDYLACIFEVNGENFDCRVLTESQGEINPGDRRVLRIVFLFPELVLPMIRTGTTFRLRDAKVIANGVVTLVAVDS